VDQFYLLEFGIMNRINLSGCVVVIAAAIGLAGCDSGGDTGGSDMNAMAAQLEQNKKAEADAAAAEQAKVQAATEQQKAVEEAAARQAAIDAAKAERASRETAAPAEGGGYYSAIVGAHRHITTRMDDLAWTQAIQHYKATTGKMPKDHEEFMREVIVAGGIPLPELEQGQEYLWDPSEGDWGTLYIVEPIPQQSPAAPATE
jgi:hypothetical protein